jgi:hypothetical protein
MFDKILLSLTLSLFMITGSLHAQAIIDFQETSYDFGEIEEGKMAQYEFVFTNTGDQPLILSSVKASCGCTTPSWTKEPILPGKTGHVKASYNSKNRPGGFHKSITITSNANKSTQVLYIKGTAVKSPEFTPLFTEEELAEAAKAEIVQTHLQLGKVQLGSSIPFSITVRNNGKSPLEISGLYSSCRCLSLMPGQRQEIEPNSTGELELVFTPRAQGEFTYGAHILSNDLVQPKYQIYVTSTVIPEQSKPSVVKESPSKISF